jgi:hypothetical protein
MKKDMKLYAILAVIGALLLFTIAILAGMQDGTFTSKHEPMFNQPYDRIVPLVILGNMSIEEGSGDCAWIYEHSSLDNDPYCKTEEKGKNGLVLPFSVRVNNTPTPTATSVASLRRPGKEVPLTYTPTFAPTPTHTPMPTHTFVPTATPTHTPAEPTHTPTLEPTATPTDVPTIAHTPTATEEPPTPTMEPTSVPTDEPTMEPTHEPTREPTHTCPTHTPRPTSTPKPTHTPRPTHTPQPTHPSCNNGNGNGAEGCSPSDNGNNDED